MVSRRRNKYAESLHSYERFLSRIPVIRTFTDYSVRRKAPRVSNRGTFKFDCPSCARRRRALLNRFRRSRLRMVLAPVVNSARVSALRLPRCKDEQSRVRRDFFAAGRPHGSGGSHHDRFTKRKCRR